MGESVEGDADGMLHDVDGAVSGEGQHGALVHFAAETIVAALQKVGAVFLDVKAYHVTGFTQQKKYYRLQLV